MSLESKVSKDDSRKPITSGSGSSPKNCISERYANYSCLVNAINCCKTLSKFLGSDKAHEIINMWNLTFTALYYEFGLSHGSQVTVALLMMTLRDYCQTILERNDQKLLYKVTSKPVNISYPTLVISSKSWSYRYLSFWSLSANIRQSYVTNEP